MALGAAAGIGFRADDASVCYGNIRKLFDERMRQAKANGHQPKGRVMAAGVARARCRCGQSLVVGYAIGLQEPQVILDFNGRCARG